MALLQSSTALVPASVTEERRRFQRVKVHILGRYMLQDRREFPCQVINMSPGGLALLAQGIGSVGERVVCYLDHIGRVEGKILHLVTGERFSSATADQRAQTSRQFVHGKRLGQVIVGAQVEPFDLLAELTARR